jgi:PPOX class probable F420-dependent enzyme
VTSRFYTAAMTIGDEKYVSVTTFRKTGVPVATTTWIVPLDAGKVGFWTSSAAGKTKRLRNNPKITVQPCDSRGRVTPGTVASEGTAEVVTSGPDFEAIQTKIKAKHRFMVPMSRLFNTLGTIGKGHHPYGDAGVVITLAS